MTMIKCSECGKDISDKAAVCIGCGAPIAGNADGSPLGNAESASNTTSRLRSFLQSGGEAIERVTAAAGNVGGKLAIQVGDLNGDGKVDEEDYKIAAQKAKQMVSTAADEVGKLGKDVLKSDLVKDVAAGAAVGAIVAVPVPIVGPAAGAVVGAGLGVYKNLTK